MSDRREQIVPLTRLGGRDSGRGAALAVGGVLVAVAALVGAGILGRLSEQPRASAAPLASPPSAPTPGPDKTAAAPGDAGDVVVVPGGGYSVRFAADSRRRPVLLDDGALAVFPFGPENAAGASDGTIQVSVGTPARAAAIMGANGPGEVFGASLEDLRLQYLGELSDHVITRSAQEIAGQTAIVVRVDDGAGGMRAVALIAHGGRNFVITASGFQILYGAISDFPAELGLERFITGFRFGTSLFVSRELGFQVPLPVDARPFGTAVKLPPGEANGLYVFGDGVAVGDRWSDSIAVSVGTMLNPALVRVLPSLNPKPTPYRIGATSLIGLQSAYLAAIADQVGSSTTVRLGGELALLIDRPDGLGATVLAVHRGRVYLVETSGAGLQDAAPHFEEFLAGFEFLD